MGLLLRLPLLLLERLLRRLLGLGRDEPTYAAAPTAPSAPPPSAPFVGETGAPDPTVPTADEVLGRRAGRDATASPGSVTPLRPISERDDGRVSSEPTVVESFGPADDVGGTITVDEPWDGYATQPAAAIVQRLRGADAATKAVVALYERGHKQRATVLRAAG